MSARVLVFGYGNPGRRDDGLGPALIGELEARGLADGVSVESDYQLAVEDAAWVADHEAVVFADADRGCEAPFEIRPLTPRDETRFTTHALSPAAVLALARLHFGAGTAGWLLGIRGYRFDEFGEELSPEARRNLGAAAEYLERALRDGVFTTKPVPVRPEV